MNFNNAHEAIEHGFALITEERKANGLFLKSDLTFNTTIANLDQYKGGLGLSMPKMVKATSKEIKVMHTKCMGPDDMITSLSGGNQQKVIFGKWLEREPQVFMMDEPTRGIDVGAKYEIYELIIKMAKQGKTVIVVSSEMPEILGITNRIGVMYLGSMVELGESYELNRHPIHPYTKALLSAIPIPDPDVAKSRSRIKLEGELPTPINPPAGCPFKGRCPMATEECGKSRPEMRDFGGHKAACFYAEAGK